MIKVDRLDEHADRPDPTSAPYAVPRPPTMTPANTRRRIWKPWIQFTPLGHAEQMTRRVPPGVAPMIQTR